MAPNTTGGNADDYTKNPLPSTERNGIRYTILVHDTIPIINPDGVVHENVYLTSTVGKDNDTMEDDST